MLKEAQTLFFASLRNKEHRRRQQAAITFLVLWVLSIVFTITTSFLLISVQALVLLNTAASLVGSVLTQSLCSRAGTQSSYPFLFGFYRLSTVVRLGGIIFLVFGCLTTIVESLHRGMHVHHSNPYYLLAMGVVQLVFQFVYRREVRICDRVTGHHGMAGAQSEDILHQSCVASMGEGSRAVGGGDFFKTSVDVQATAGSPTITVANGFGAGSSASGRTVHNKVTAALLYLLCPLTCVVVSVLLMLFGYAVIDTAAALLLAAYFGYTGYREGRTLLDLLMNKCVTDVRRNRSLERCLRNVKMLDGVLQVQSTVWWNVNVAESMLLLRVRLMSGCDACAVSQAVRRQVVDVATHIYVECFPANGTDGGFGGDGALPTWGAPSAGAGNGHHHHSHSHDHDHSHEHGHSHSHHHHHHHPSGREESGGEDREGGRSDHDSFDAATEEFGSRHCSTATAPPPLREPSSSNSIGGQNGGGGGGGEVAGLSSAAAPHATSLSRPPMFGASPLSAAAPPAFFPAPPVASSVEGGNRLSRPASTVPSPAQPWNSGSGVHAYAGGYDGRSNLSHDAAGALTGNSSGGTGRGNGSSAFPPPFPQAPFSAYSGVGGTVVSPSGDARFGQPTHRHVGATAGAFPQPPVSPARTADMPPPVFSPFRAMDDKKSSASTRDYDV